MPNVKDLLSKIESGDISYEEKLAALSQVEASLQEMKAKKEERVKFNVQLIIDEIKKIKQDVQAQLDLARSIIIERGPKGDQGERGLDGAPGRDGIDGRNGRDGIDGRNGRDGKDGKDGNDGSDGISVTDARIDFDGSLIITLSTGREINVGEVVSPDLAEKIKVTMSTNSSLTVADEGSVLTSSVRKINFVGAAVTASNTGDDVTVNVSAATGSVTSVAMTTPAGLQVSGSPITTSGTLALAYASGYSIPTTSSQTNWDTAYTDRLKWDGGSTGLNASTGRTSLGLGTAATLNAGSANGVATLDGSGTVPTSQLPAAVLGGVKYQGTWNASTNTPTLASGTGIQGYYYVVSVAGSTNLNGITDWKIGDWAIYNGTAWQKVDNTDSVTSVNGYTGTVVLAASDVGAYPNTNPNGYTSNTGTVTSVAMTTPTGLSVSGSPITTTGTLALSMTAGYSIPTTASQTNWDSAYSERRQWDGGSTNLVAPTGRTSLGATTLGSNLFTITDPGAITFPRFNADNTVSALTAPSFRTAIGAGTGDGTVTSVGATSPVASSGGATPTISLSSGYGDTQNPYASKTANFFLAAPNGSAGAPTFRAIVAADVPTLNQNTTGTASNVTGTVAIANGGTGQITQQAALNALAGSTTSAQFLRGNGTNVLMSAIQASDVPTLNQNTTGTASNVTGVVAVANGGTGLSSTPVNGALDIGNGTGFTRATLTAGTGISISNGSGSITIASSVTPVTSVTGTSPVVSSGGTTPAISLASGYGDTQNPYTSKTANFILAAPNGIAGVPTFRAIVAADIPTLNQNTTGTASNVTGVVALANGGSGQTTAQSAMNTFAGAVTSGSYLRGNGSNVVMSTIQAADVPTLNQNTTGTASNVTGTIAIANGGTGETTRQEAMDALAGAVTAGQYLRGNGTDVVMSTIQVSDVPTLNQNTTGTASNVTGTVAVANGGTGQTSYTDGQLLIGNSTGNTLTKATLTQGSGITITNGSGSISIDNAAPMTYPGAGIPNSTGTAWGTSYSTTGSGTVVALATSPSFTTPSLGAATATTINKVTFTAPATGSTLTIADGKTLTVNNSITFSGTDATTMTLPTTNATLAGLAVAQTFTATQTFSQINFTVNTVTVSANAGTVPITHRLHTFTNSSAAAMTITLATASAVDGQMAIVRIFDFSAAAQTINWVNTENSTVTVPTTSNGSTTLPLTVGFMYNNATSKWRCVASA